MNYNFQRSYEVLERTPLVLDTFLRNLPVAWTMANEGPDTFSPYDVIGHLVHGEKTDWKLRSEMILDHGVAKSFIPFDRFAQYEESKGKSLEQLLDEFRHLREKNMEWLRSLSLTESDLEKQGLHPDLGKVTLRQLLATWVIHDLTHIAQVARVMAKQYKEEMGPWIEYFRIMRF